MASSVFAICRETHFDLERVGVEHDLTAEYTVCLEDLTFTLLPSVLLCVLLPWSKAVWSFAWRGDWVRKVACGVLSGVAIGELVLLSYRHSVQSIAVVYALVEAGAWLLGSLYDTSTESSPVSAMIWKSLWLVLGFSALLKLGTFAVISVMDWVWSPGILILLGVKGVLAVTVTVSLWPRWAQKEAAVQTASVPVATSSVTKWVVTAVLLNSQMTYGLGVLTLPAYALTLHATTLSIGLIFGAYSLAIVIFSPLFSRLSITCGRISVLVTGCVCLSLSTLLFAAAKSIPALILARGLQGIAASASFTPALALLTDSTSALELGKVLGEVTGWAGLGMLLGPPFGSLLYAWKGYSMPFYFGACSSLLTAAVAWSLLQEKPHTDRVTSPPSYSKFLPILGAIGLGAGTLTMLEPMIPILLRSKFSVSPSIMGLIFSLLVLVFGVMSPVAGKISDTAGRLPVLICGLLFLGSALPILALPDSLYLETGSLILIGAALALVLVPTLPELADQARKQGICAYEEIYALFNSSYAVGSMVGPVAGGMVVQELGLQTGLLCFGVALIAYSTCLSCGQSEEGKSKEATSLLNSV